MIAAAIGGLEDLVRDGETGLLVGPGDADSLAEAMLAIAADPAKAVAMGIEARRRAIERFPELRCTERTEEVYRHWLDVRHHGRLDPEPPGAPGGSRQRRDARLEEAGATRTSGRRSPGCPIVGRRAYSGPMKTATRALRETVQLLLDLPFGILGFTLVVTGFSVGVGMLITLVGVPILVGTLLAARGLGLADRARANWLLGLDVPRPARRPAATGFLRQLIAPMRDAANWKASAYLLLMLPVGVVNFSVAVAIWSAALPALFLPALRVGAPRKRARALEQHPPATAGGRSPRSAESALLLTLAAPWIIRPFALLDGVLVKALLGASAKDARIEQLQETRARSVDAAVEERRRIERDLHDGAQQRLVRLGMDLGLALEKFDEDPDGARELVGEAHHEAQRAIVELRDLVRGLHPAVLEDRGLDAALSALAARAPIPVVLDVDRARPPAGLGRGERVLHRRRGAHERGQARRGARCLRGRALGERLPADRGRRRRPRRRRRREGLRPRRARGPRGGRRRHLLGGLAARRWNDRDRGAAVRIVIAEDSVLLRDGLTRLLAERGHEVVATAGDAVELLAAVAREAPDVAIVDVRMPPTFTDEGVRAALELRERNPALAVLVLSQYVEERYAGELLARDARGVGYLLKDSVTETRDFLEAVDRVAAGGTAIDPEVVSQLLARARRGDPLDDLSPREREVLSLMAEGRSNAAIAARLVITERAVEKHVSSIFAKLRLPPTEGDHRRVLAVLRYLEAAR